jgi:hypothetical protein
MGEVVSPLSCSGGVVGGVERFAAAGLPGNGPLRIASIGRPAAGTVNSTERQRPGIDPLIHLSATSTATFGLGFG